MSRRFTKGFALLLALLASFVPGTASSAWAPNGTPVCTAVNAQESSAITTDGAGGAIITWADDRLSSHSDIFAQRLDGSGVPQWIGGGVPVCTAAFGQTSPLILSDFASGAFVVWEDSRTGGAGDGIYAQRMNSAGSPVWTLNGIPLVTGDLAFRNVNTIADGSSGAVIARGYIVAWIEQDPPNLDVAGIRAQHVDVTGDALWTNPAEGGITIASDLSDKSGLTMATDGVGTIHVPKGAFLAWTDDRNGPYDIYAGRISGSGASQWAVDGVNVCIATGSQMNPDLANVGAGVGIVVWEDWRSGGPPDIYAQKMDSAGGMLWFTNGLPVCMALDAQELPKILRDGSGGAFVVWRDRRDGSKYRTYAQRIDANGQPVWTPNGICVAPASEGVTDMTLTSDAAGGFIVAWTDHRAGTAGDIYAQRVDPDGNVLWGADAPICSASGIQVHPVLTGAPSNGVFCAWDDVRAGNVDIYANLVTGGGGVTAVSLAGFEAPLLALASADPTRGPARFQLQLPGASAVTMDVCDVAGRRIRSIASGSLGAGRHEVSWDGADDIGRAVGAGVYFVRLKAGERSETSRVVVVK